LSKRAIARHDRVVILTLVMAIAPKSFSLEWTLHQQLVSGGRVREPG
jgi:hypothetical protein